MTYFMDDPQDKFKFIYCNHLKSHLKQRTRSKSHEMETMEGH